MEHGRSVVDEHPDFDAIRSVFKRDELFRPFLSPRSLHVLDEIIDHSTFPGSSDPHALSFLTHLVKLTRPARALQLGTYIGFSAIVMGDVLSRNGGALVTVDPVPLAHELARRWVQEARLEETVTFIDAASTDPAGQAAITQGGPYELIYLDSSHAYRETLDELDLIFERTSWLSPHGILVMHDAAQEAARFDPSASGGVRRALDEWIAPRREAYQLLVLEPPLWPAGCGLGLMTRRDS